MSNNLIPTQYKQYTSPTKTLVNETANMFLKTFARVSKIQTVRNYEGDGNENVEEKAISLICKPTYLNLNHAFMQISLPSLRNYDVIRGDLCQIALWAGLFEETVRRVLDPVFWGLTKVARETEYVFIQIALWDCLKRRTNGFWPGLQWNFVIANKRRNSVTKTVPKYNWTQHTALGSQYNS